LSKTLERLVARQLVDYLSERKLLPELQSAYRAYHSTETAVLRVLSDIFEVLDRGDWAALTLLDLSAAFDTSTTRRLFDACRFLTASTTSSSAGFRPTCTADHSTFAAAILLPCYQFCWFQGPILFLLYTADLMKLITTSGLCLHIYADDTQIYGFCAPTGTQALLDQVAACISDVSSWMKSNRLQLNTDKTEALWCVPARHQHLIPNSPLSVCSDNIVPSKHVRDLGIYIDSDMSMRTHVSRTVYSCFAALRQIKSIQRSVSQPVLLSLVSSLVL